MPGRSMVRALAHRNFRLFLIGQTLSLVGTWTQSTAMPWLVARLTGSTWLTGQVGFFSQLPCLFLAPVAGIVTEHANRQRLLIVTQSLAMVQALVLAFMVLAGVIQVWHIILLNALLNAVNAFDMTARQTFLGDMLDRREDLANAIALNSMIVNGSRLFGPALAAWLIATAGEGGCFLINAMSFVAVLAAILVMRLPERAAGTRRRPPAMQGLSEGVRYALGTPPIRATLMLVGLTSLVGLPYSTLVPFVATNILHGDATTYGWLMTAPGIGAFSAGVMLSWIGLRHIVVRMAVAPIVAGLCLVGFSYAGNLPAALALLFGSGFAFLTLLNSCNTLVQAVVADDKRGRVMSLYTMMFLGISPLGSVLVGYLADPSRLHLDGALRICGSACIVGGLLFAVGSRKWRIETERRLVTARTPLDESPAFPVRGADTEEPQSAATPSDAARLAPAERLDAK